MRWISRSGVHWSVSQPPSVEMCLNPSITPQCELWPWLCKAVMSLWNCRGRTERGTCCKLYAVAAAEEKISMDTTTVGV